jgi:hypothetical protein
MGHLHIRFCIKLVCLFKCVFKNAFAYCKIVLTCKRAIMGHLHIRFCIKLVCLFKKKRIHQPFAKFDSEIERLNDPY